MKKVNVGFIGVGSFISMHHLPHAAECDFMRIRAIADLNRELLELRQKCYKPDYVTEDYRQILDDPKQS